jgi:hypothetical protein
MTAVALLLAGCTKQQAAPASMAMPSSKAAPAPASQVAAEDWPPVGVPAEDFPAAAPSAEVLPPGTFAEYEFDGAYIPPMRVSFTVLEDGEAERLVELRARPRGEAALPGPLRRPVVFAMRKQPLPGEAGRLPGGHNDATDRVPAHGAEFGPHPLEVRPVEVEAGGGTFACAEFERRRSAYLTRGCVAARDARIEFAGGAVWLEEAWGTWTPPLQRLRLVAHGVRPLGPRDAVLAVRSGQEATYEVRLGEQRYAETHVWTTDSMRVRHAVNGKGPYGNPSVEREWEGTLLDMVFVLAKLKSPLAEYASDVREPTRGVVQVDGGRLAVIQRTLSGMGPGDGHFTGQLALAEDPWVLDDAPVWVRFWPLRSTYRDEGGSTTHFELKHWK